MDRQPLVSIVIPTYNRACDLGRALASVVAQTYCAWEALIVDNHSTDDTVEVVNRFNDSRIKLLSIHNDGVIAASRNLGITHASGEYVAFLDSDDWWRPEKLAQSVNALEQGADLVYHGMFLATRPGQRWFWRRARSRNLKSPVFRDLIANGTTLNTSSVVARRKVMQAINGFSEDQSLITAEDFDAWLRAAKITDRFVRIPRTLGYYWAGGGNMSGPRRTLLTIGTLESRYATAIRGVNAESEVYWIDYGRGRAHYRLGSYAAAKRAFALVRWRRSPISIYVKSRWMLLLINLHLHSQKSGAPCA